ncbi:MAG: metallophosphoesterase family protein [Tepidanaerobacteraceae bacterium]
MRILIIADIHGNWEALQSIVEAETYDILICAGDIVDFGSRPRKCVDYIKNNCNIAVMGNHDWAVADNSDPGAVNDTWRSICRKSGFITRKQLGVTNLKYLLDLPVKRHVKINGEYFFIIHGAPSNPLGKYVERSASVDELDYEFGRVDAKYIIIGHSHFPMLKKIRDKYIINPGSVGQPRDGYNTASYVVLEDGEILFKRIAYDIDSSLKGYNNWRLTKEEYEQLAQLLKTGSYEEMHLRPELYRAKIEIDIT